MLFTLMLALSDLTVKIDDRLISYIGNGGKQAFRKLYESTYESVYGFVLSIVKNKYDAEDVLHKTFNGVYKYGVEFIKNNMYYECEINAENKKLFIMKKSRLT